MASGMYSIPRKADVIQPLPPNFSREWGEFVDENGLLDRNEYPVYEDLIESGKLNEYLERAERGEKFSIMLNVPLSQCYKNPTFQRDESPAKIAQISTNLNPRAAGRIIAAYDPKHGGPWQIFSVLDGWHRYGSFRSRGIQRRTMEIHFGLTLEEQAEIFIICNTTAKTATPFEVFRAALVARKGWALETELLLSEIGIKFIPNTAPKVRQYETKAVASVVRLFTKFGPNHMRSVMSLVRDIWDGNPITLNEYFIGAVHLFYRAFGEKINVGRLIKVVRAGEEPIALYAHANSKANMDKIENRKTSTAMYIARRMVEMYNARLNSGEFLNEAELNPKYRMKIQGERRRRFKIAKAAND